MNDIQLEPCPFCGGEALIEPKNWCGRDYIGVFCKECLIFQDSRSATEAEAIAAWNTRALSSPPNVGEGDKPSPELVEAVYKRLRGLKLSNMADADTGDPYPLVDAVSAEGQSIASGEEQLGEIAFEAAEAALAALSTPPHDRATIRREAFEEAAKVAEYFYDNSLKLMPSLQVKIATAIRALKETPA